MRDATPARSADEWIRRVAAETARRRLWSRGALRVVAKNAGRVRTVARLVRLVGVRETANRIVTELRR